MLFIFYDIINFMIQMTRIYGKYIMLLTLLQLYAYYYLYSETNDRESCLRCLSSFNQLPS